METRAGAAPRASARRPPPTGTRRGARAARVRRVDEEVERAGRCPRSRAGETQEHEIAARRAPSTWSGRESRRRTAPPGKGLARSGSLAAGDPHRKSAATHSRTHSRLRFPGLPVLPRAIVCARSSWRAPQARAILRRALKRRRSRRCSCPPASGPARAVEVHRRAAVRRARVQARVAVGVHRRVPGSHTIAMRGRP